MIDSGVNIRQSSLFLLGKKIVETAAYTITQIFLRPRRIIFFIFLLSAQPSLCCFGTYHPFNWILLSGCDGGSSKIPGPGILLILSMSVI